MQVPITHRNRLDERTKTLNVAGRKRFEKIQAEEAEKRKAETQDLQRKSASSDRQLQDLKTESAFHSPPRETRRALFELGCSVQNEAKSGRIWKVK